MTTARRFVALFVLPLVFFARGSAADDGPITITSIADPPASAGIDQASLRNAAQEHIRALDGTHLKRPIAITIAVVGATNAPASCVVNATVLDRRTGAMLGVAAGYAEASYGAPGDQRPAVARTAVRNAVNRILDVVIASGAAKK
jgi:hypothetical protein